MVSYRFFVKRLKIAAKSSLLVIGVMQLVIKIESYQSLPLFTCLYSYLVFSGDPGLPNFPSVFFFHVFIREHIRINVTQKNC